MPDSPAVVRAEDMAPGMVELPVTQCPSVTVVMANYNYGEFLERALQSVENQTYAGEVEIVIVDGGSVDKSFDVYDRFKQNLAVIHKPWTTLGAALNVGLRAARGEYVARLDCDDEWEPVKIQRQVAFMRHHPRCVLSHTAAKHIDAQSRFLRIESINPKYNRRNQLRTLLTTNPVRHSSVMFHRTLLVVNDLWYNEALPYSEDLDLWFRIYKGCEVGYIDQPLLRFRIHSQNVSINQREPQAEVTRSILHSYCSIYPLEDFYPVLRWREEKVGRTSSLRNYCHLDMATRLEQAGLFFEAGLHRQAVVAAYREQSRLKTDGQLHSDVYHGWPRAYPWDEFHPLVRLVGRVGERWFSAIRARSGHHRGRVSVLALVENHPKQGLSARFRISNYRHVFNTAGLTLTVSPGWPPSNFIHTHRLPRFLRGLGKAVLAIQIVRRLVDVFRAPFYDVVIIQRELLPGYHTFVEQLMRACSHTLILDVDDALYAAPSWVSNPTEGRLRAAKFAKLAALADLVVVGNVNIADHVVSHNQRLIVIPTPIESVSRAVSVSPPHKIPVLGWVGTWGNLFYLGKLRSVLQQLSMDYDFELRVIVDAPRDTSLLKFPGVKMKHVLWNRKTSEEELWKFNIGLMPLTDDEWARGKCAFKLLQYMAAGIAVVASPVGMNVEVVDHGKTGFLARSDDEWFRYLSQLISSPEMRASMGARGAERVKQEFSVNRLGEQLAVAIREVHDARREGAQVSIPLDDPS